MIVTSSIVTKPYITPVGEAQQPKAALPGEGSGETKAQQGSDSPQRSITAADQLAGLATLLSLLLLTERAGERAARTFGSEPMKKTFMRQHKEGKIPKWQRNLGIGAAGWIWGTPGHVFMMALNSLRRVADKPPLGHYRNGVKPTISAQSSRPTARRI
jgi:hypothetical protein